MIGRLNGVLDAMADVTTVNRIIEMLVKIEKGEREEYERLRKLLKQKQDEVLENSVRAEEATEVSCCYRRLSMTPCWFALGVAVLLSGGDTSEDTKKGAGKIPRHVEVRLDGS